MEIRKNSEQYLSKMVQEIRNMKKISGNKENQAQNIPVKTVQKEPILLSANPFSGIHLKSS